MNLYLTGELSPDEIFKQVQEHLKIHTKVTVYYKGVMVGTFTAPSQNVSITNKTYPASWVELNK